jgi:histidine triad (HIT) family protein
MIKLSDPYDEQNIFAKILRGDLPSIKIYEDDETLAFMDIMPQTDGHVLVIPKRPAVHLLTLPDDIAGPILITARKVADAVRKAMGADGIMIAQLSGSDAGQTVPHFHIHILPRHNGIDLAFHARDVADMDELAEIADKIKAEL